MACLNHLVQKVGGSFTIVDLLLEARHSFSKCGQLCQLGRDVLLLSQLIGLVLRDLLLGPSPLAAGLHQVGGDALGDYKDTKMNNKAESMNTYD